MKKFLLAIATLLATITCFDSALAKAIQVKGYFKKNGTYVAPHTRNTSSRSRAKHSSTTTATPKITQTPRTTNVFQSIKSIDHAVKASQGGSRVSKTSSANSDQGPRAFSRSMRKKKYEEQGGICSHCGGHFALSEMHADHIVPYSKGGKTEWSNLQMLCKKCNLKKGNRYSH